MATGAVPASFSGLRRMDCNLGSAKSMDLLRVSDVQRVRYGRRKVFVIRNSNHIAEVQTSSEGSPLLGIISVVYHFLFSLCLVY